MKLNPILYSLMVLPAVSVTWADISVGRPGIVNTPRQGVYHSDLLASNAVHAVFKGIRSIPVVDLNVPDPGMEEVAVFEVKQNLASRRYDRMGDGAMNPGKVFAVSLAADVPGQEADLGRQIREMKPGDEALMNIDHIYLFREEGNKDVHACTRFARVQPQPPVPATPTVPPTPSADGTSPAAPGVPAPQPTDGAPAQPGPTDQPAPPTPAPTPTPATNSVPTTPPQQTTSDEVPEPQPLIQNDSTGGNFSRSVETSISIVPDGKGGMKETRIEIRRERSGDGPEKVRKFINGTEVNPETDQPLK